MQVPDPIPPEFPVQRQLEAYNARDIDAFMRWWADDCRYHEFPGRLLATGAAEIRERHVVRFREPDLHGRLVNRIAVGDVVVDQEIVTRTFPDGPGEVDVVAIYQVTDGRIAGAWFRMGPPRPIPRIQEPHTAAARDVRVCFVGDSFVNGTGDNEALGWAGRVCRAARAGGVPLTHYDLGVRGDTSALILRRCAAEVAARLDGVPCDGWVVFSFGANDATHVAGQPRVDLADTLANARALLTWSRGRHRTLMVGPPPVADDPAHDGRVAALSAALGRLCAELGVPFLDLHGPLSEDEAWRAEAMVGDGVHPGGRRYGRIAVLVEAWAPWRAWIRDDTAGAVPELRRAGSANAGAVRELTRAAYAKWVPVIGREPRPMTADYDVAVRDHQVDLLQVGGATVALIEMSPGPDHLLIVNVAVAPAFQGRGHGRALLAHAEQVAASLGLDEVRLYTNGRFTENLQLYRRVGYRVDREEQHPQFGMTTYMSKRLSTGVSTGTSDAGLPAP